jgi:hypothetical protein
MAPPRRDHQQCLADRIPALGRPVEQQRTDFIGPFGAAGLARRDRVFAGSAESLDDQLLLRRLARAFPAFERDELAATQFFFPNKR